MMKPNKSEYGTPDPPRVQAVMTIRTSTHIRSLAPVQAWEDSTFGIEMRMRKILSFIVALLFGSAAAANELRLHWSPENSPKRTEGIMVWVRDDGELLSDSGLRTTDQLLQTCEEWRKQGTEPSIRIVLIPKLKTNLDIGVIWPLMRALKEQNVPFEILIADSGDDPPRDLVTNKETEQASGGQPATRSDLDSEGDEKPEPESEGRSR